MEKLFFLDELQELFTVVQNSGIFADQKAFADCVPKAPAATILQTYRQQNQDADFDLAAFVAHWFTVPAYNKTHFASNTALSATQHIEQLWDVLTLTATATEGTAIGLPYPYVVPGGRFRELFYWDSYFTMLGLQVSGRIALVENMVNNFAYLINTFGFIPNGTATYFLSRSQPPLFSFMVQLLSEEKGNNVYIQYLPQLTAEYDFWMQDSTLLTGSNSKSKRVVLLPDGSILNRYWDAKDTPREEGYAEDIATARKAGADDSEVFRNIRAACESGWDFSGRWLKNKNDISSINTTDIVPVDLNCLLLHLENTLAHAHTLLQDTATATAYTAKATSRSAAIQKYLWSDAQQTFCDYLHSQNAPSAYLSMAMAFPLFVNIATAAQATAVLTVMEEKLLRPGGLLVTPYYTGQQWDAPNGWAPLQWIGFKAALNYGNTLLAENIRHNWVSNVERVYKRSGKMMEKYNVEDISKVAGGGEYPNQDGFGWTNGVYLKFISHQ